MIQALPNIAVVIIRMDKVPYVDQSGLYAMEEAVQDLQGKGIAVVFTDLHGQPRDMFERINLVPGLVGYEYCFDSFKACIDWLNQYIEDEKLLHDILQKQLDTKGKVSDEVAEM